jgi:hypothetical protein
MASLTLITCHKCGTPFGMEDAIYDEAQKGIRSFFCPNGHEAVFIDNELTKTKKQLENVQKRLEWAQQENEVKREQLQHAENRRRSIAGHATRLRKRVAQGQCPCCSQRFKDLEEHIATEHPRYKPKEDT